MVDRFIVLLRTTSRIYKKKTLLFLFIEFHQILNTNDHRCTQIYRDKRQSTNNRTCLLRTQWSKKINIPWLALKTAKRYLKKSVSRLNVIKPNTQVRPSIGKITTEALTPALTLLTASCCFTLWEFNIVRSTMMNTMVFT